MALSEYLKKLQAEKSLGKIKPGTVMTAAQFKKEFAGKKVGANPMEGKFKADHYECSKGKVWFRSQWEANYALYLDWLVGHGTIKDWQYEADTFFFEGIKMGTNSYKPDFKIFINDGSVIYHEIKGYMDSKSRTKLKRMKKYHPKVEVILVERKGYTKILKDFRGLIKFYK